MKVIELTAGRVAVVDDEDFEYLAQWRWQYEPTRNFVAGDERPLGYAVRDRPRQNGKRLSKIRMHRVIMRAPDGIEIDHINGNGLDNRKCNLRFASRTQQLMNTAIRSDNTTGCKGVGRFRNGYRARIKVNGTEHHLGVFDRLEDAVASRKSAEPIYHGSFARQTPDA